MSCTSGQGRPSSLFAPTASRNSARLRSTFSLRVVLGQAEIQRPAAVAGRNTTLPRAESVDQPRQLRQTLRAQNLNRACLDLAGERRVDGGSSWLEDDAWRLAARLHSRADSESNRPTRSPWLAAPREPGFAAGIPNTIAWRCSSTTSPIARGFRRNRRAAARARCSAGSRKRPARAWTTFSSGKKTSRRATWNASRVRRCVTVRDNSATTKLLINGRADVALACGADGVHLPAGDVAASEVRALWMRCQPAEPLIGVSAHTIDDVRDAEAQGADFAVLAPIFEKVQTGTPGIGLEALRARDRSGEASRRFAVLALGGVTLSNARACIEAGAAGVAGIRLFQQGDVFETVRRLRATIRIHRRRRLLRLHVNRIVRRGRLVILAVLVLVRGGGRGHLYTHRAHGMRRRADIHGAG